MSEYKCTLQFSDDGDPIYEGDPSYNADDSLKVEPDVNDVCLDFAVPDRCLANKPSNAEEEEWENLPYNHSYLKASTLGDGYDILVDRGVLTT